MDKNLRAGFCDMIRCGQGSNRGNGRQVFPWTLGKLPYPRARPNRPAERDLVGEGNNPGGPGPLAGSNPLGVFWNPTAPELPIKTGPSGWWNPMGRPKGTEHLESKPGLRPFWNKPQGKQGPPNRKKFPPRPGGKPWFSFKGFSPLGWENLERGNPFSPGQHP